MRYIESAAVWVLFAAVWCIYVIDRIIDVWTGKRDKAETHRHAFSWNYRWPLLITVFCVASYSIHYALYHLPATLFTSGFAAVVASFLYLWAVVVKRSSKPWLREMPVIIFCLMMAAFIYEQGCQVLIGDSVSLTKLIVGGVAIGCSFALYRALVFLRGDVIPYAKNLGAGIIFAFGVAVPARLYQLNTESIINDIFYPVMDKNRNVFMGIFDTVYNLAIMVMEHMTILIGTIETVTFGVLCMLNITAIDLWENARESDDPEVKATNEMILTMGIMALVGFCLLYSLLWAPDTARHYYFAIMVACGILHLINRLRSNFTLDAQRVLADIALLAPIPFYFLFNSNL